MLKRRSRYTGPSAATRSTVRGRADHRCEWPDCGQPGVQYHHRLNRKMGGRHGKRREQLNQASWLLYACHLHHEQVTSAFGEVLDDAKSMGWVLTETQNALEEPVHTALGRLLLDDKGGYEVLPEVAC